MKHVFGPVPSRRLGRSLGIDVVPFKTCTYDCIYCQLGKTTDKSIERRPYVSPSDVLEEVKEKLVLKPDYITLSGSGEPTLCTNLGGFIDSIRAITNVPVAVLTNGSLLWQDEVRQELSAANLIVPSLDAGHAAAFSEVNRPHLAISFEQMVEGLITFSEMYRGRIWLELFVIGGYTASTEEMRKIAEWVKRIKPDRVQLNTVTRPPAERYARTVQKSRLQEFACLFTPRAEVIAEFRGTAHTDFATTQDAVFQMLERRPASLRDVTEGLGIHRNEALKYIETLLADQHIETVQSTDTLYYRASRTPDASGT